MKKISLIFGVLSSFIVIFSCADNYVVKEGSYAPVRIRDENLPGTQIRWNSVSLLDKSIEHKVLVEATNTRRTSTNTIEVWATFRNRTDYPLQIEARASFFDDTQAPLEGPTAWNRIFLPPNASASYKEFSTAINISYYTIEVREGR